MKKTLLFLLVLISTASLFAQNPSEDTLEQLSHTITKKQDFDAQKLKRISRLEHTLNQDLSLAEKYRLFSALYHEYKSFNYDKAFFYSQRMQATGHLMNDPVKISDGKIKFGFILLSSGMFKETFDSLNTVDVKILPDSLKQECYFLTARTYYDLADYDKDNYYAPIYNKRAGIYIDSAIALSDPKCYSYSYNLGLKYLKLGKRDEAAVLLNKLMKDYQLSDHQLAVTASTLSDIVTLPKNRTV